MNPGLLLETIEVSVAGAVATIILNRPRVLNCANQTLVDDLHHAIDMVAGQPNVRVVIIRGAGRAFCTGIDLDALASNGITPEFFHSWELALRKLELLDAVVVAAVHSHCIGGGLQLALACDLRVARADARFGLTAVKEGIIPGMGVWRLARHVGLGRARRLALTADVIDAETARQWGLVDDVVDPGEFEAHIVKRTGGLLAMAWTSTRLTKRLLADVFDAPFDEFVQTFCRAQQQAVDSPEHGEAMARRLAERPWVREQS